MISAENITSRKSYQNIDSFTNYAILQYSILEIYGDIDAFIRIHMS